MNLKSYKVAILLLALFISKVSAAQTFNANFGYNINCKKITLTDSSIGANNQHYWTFGDGSYDYSKNTSHTYSLNGNYTVTLIITSYDSSSSNFLKQDTMAQQITINCNICNIQANFSTDRDKTNDKKIIFTNYTSGQTNYNTYWNFGYSGNSGSNAKNTSHTYPNYGKYIVTLTSSYYDSLLSKVCVDSIMKEVIVSQLRANFSYTIDSKNCTTVTFTDSSSGSPDNYHWEFGVNGGTSTNPNPIYTYPIGNGTDTQTFNVRLRVYNFDSSTSTYHGDTIIKQIIIPPCNICQIYASIYLISDSTTAWSGTIYNYSSGKINKHYWDFGDGSTSTSNAPVHSYANPGKYTIMYIAMDTIKNCRDTTWTTFTIDSSGFLKRNAFVMTVIDKTTTAISKVDILLKNTLNAYPNPANNYFILEGIRQHVVVFNLMGSKVGEYQVNNDEPMKINIESWTKGLYIITGENNNRIKLVIE